MIFVTVKDHGAGGDDFKLFAIGEGWGDGIGNVIRLCPLVVEEGGVMGMGKG